MGSKPSSQRPRYTRTRAFWKPAKVAQRAAGLSYINPELLASHKDQRWDCDLCGCSNAPDLFKCFGCGTAR